MRPRRRRRGGAASRRRRRGDHVMRGASRSLDAVRMHRHRKRNDPRHRAMATSRISEVKAPQHFKTRRSCPPSGYGSSPCRPVWPSTSESAASERVVEPSTPSTRRVPHLWPSESGLAISAPMFSAQTRTRPPSDAKHLTPTATHLKLKGVFCTGLDLLVQEVELRLHLVPIIYFASVRNLAYYSLHAVPGLVFC